MVQVARQPKAPTINRLLIHVRHKHGWTQSELAQYLGTTPLTVSRWERGLTAPGPFLHSRLCELFDKSPEELGLYPLATERAVSPEVLPLYLALYDPALPLGDNEHIVGRTSLLHELREQLATTATSNRIALFGLPGVGKTTLATSLAHDPYVQEAFQDGILWVGLGPDPNLLGHLARLGALLGITPKSADLQQGDLVSWATLLRSAIGSRHILLVIDDAWTIEDALALQVGGPGCAYLLTTRFPDLASYFAGESAFHVDELSEEEGLQLLMHLVPHTIHIETQQVQQLVRKVGALPLALTLMGRYLRSQAVAGQPRRLWRALQQLDVAQIRLELSEPQAPLERSTSLPAGASLSLQSVIAASLRRLGEQPQAALYALALFPAKPNSFSEEAALMVSAVGEDALDALWDAGLLESRGTGRFSLHATVADFARDHLTDPAPLERFVAYMEHFVRSHTSDFVLLEREGANVFAALQVAHDRGWHTSFVSMINRLAHFWEARGLGKQAYTWLQPALLAARALENPKDVAQTLLSMGRLAQRTGNYQSATELYKEGLDWAERSGESGLIADLIRNLGVVSDALGAYDQAEAYFARGLVLARQSEDQGHVPIFLNSLGLQAFRRGELERAEMLWREGLAIAHETGDREQEAFLLNDLANIADAREDYREAEDLFRQAQRLAEMLGHMELKAGIQGNLGSVARKTGNLTYAEVSLLEALELAKQVDHHWIVINVLLELGDLYLVQQRFASAERVFTEALQSLPEGNQELSATALFGLAKVAKAQDDVITARARAEVCLECFEALGHTKRAEVRDWLHALPVTGKERESA